VRVCATQTVAVVRRWLLCRQSEFEPQTGMVLPVIHAGLLFLRHGSVGSVLEG